MGTFGRQQEEVNRMEVEVAQEERYDECKGYQPLLAWKGKAVDKEDCHPHPIPLSPPASPPRSSPSSTAYALPSSKHSFSLPSCSTSQADELTSSKERIPPSPRSEETAASRLPIEVLRLIFDATGDWELATTLYAPHSLPITSPWIEQALPLDFAILSSSTSLYPVKHALSSGHTRFTQWGARAMIRFGYVHLLEFFLEEMEGQLREMCYTLLPVVASAWGRVEVLKWATESAFNLRPDRSTMAEAVDDASRHGQVEVLEFWKTSGLHLHYSENALSSASVKGQIGSLEWWKQSGLPLKIGNVLDYSSMEGTTKCLDWWTASGLPCPYSKAALFHLSQTGNVALLNWWFHSPHPLLFDKTCILIATKHGQTSALTWWAQSGLVVEYRFFDIEEALEDCVGGKEEVERWWVEKRGYGLGLSAGEWTKIRYFGAEED